MNLKDFDETSSEDIDLDDVLIASAGRATLVIKELIPELSEGEVCNILYSVFIGEWDEAAPSEVVDAIRDTITASSTKVQ